MLNFEIVPGMGAWRWRWQTITPEGEPYGKVRYARTLQGAVRAIRRWNRRHGPGVGVVAIRMPA